MELDYVAEALFGVVPRDTAGPITIRLFGGGEWVHKHPNFTQR